METPLDHFFNDRIEPENFEREINGSVPWIKTGKVQYKFYGILSRSFSQRERNQRI
jgi:hypothetical protein